MRIGVRVSEHGTRLDAKGSDGKSGEIVTCRPVPALNMRGAALNMRGLGKSHGERSIRFPV